MSKVLVFTARSIVERDALISSLNDHNIESISPDRDISRKYTENTFDISYGGYSVIFDGFKVFVDEEGTEGAKKIVKDFEEGLVLKNREQRHTSKNYLNKFYFFSLSGFFIPLLPVFFGVYYLYKGLKEGERLRGFYTVAATVFYGISFFVGLVIIQNALKSFF